MKGRNIMNGIMALHDVLHETKRKNEVGVILKLDIEKAYERLTITSYSMHLSFGASLRSGVVG